MSGLHQGAGHLGGGLHPGRDDQQQAPLPRQALPRPGPLDTISIYLHNIYTITTQYLPGADLQDPGGAGQPHPGRHLLHHQPQGAALREQPARPTSGGLAQGLPRRQPEVRLL